MDEIWCEGELKGDPDIAGVGVVSSIFATTGLAIIFSWLLWYFTLWHGKTIHNSTLYRALTKSAFVLADIQLATALAITCSSIILIRTSGETSLYHVLIARCLAQANFTGYGAALTFDTRTQSNWSLRVILLGCAILLYIYWSILGIHEFQNWDNQAPKCFYNDSWIPLWYTIWMYIDMPWLFLGWLWVFAEATGKFQHRLIRWNHQTVQLLKGAGTEFLRALGCGRLSAVPKSLGIAVAKLFMFLIIALVVFPPSTTPFTATVFFIWHIYDTTTARRSNRHILVASPASFENMSLQYHTNPEDDIGFGQLLPLFLLILPILQIVDIFTETEEQANRVSYYYNSGYDGVGWARDVQQILPKWPGQAPGTSTSSQQPGTAQSTVRRTRTGLASAPTRSAPPRRNL